MNMATLEGKVALVTGGTRGIGFAACRRLADAGAHVILTGKTGVSAQEAVERLSLGGGNFSSVACDVSDPEQVRAAFQWVFKEHGRLDVLIANAGVLQDSLIGMVTPSLIADVFSVNVNGVLYCAQYASRLMGRSGGGSIIIISSIIGTNGNLGQSVYSASKAAVIGASKSLAKELASKNIRVNTIAPGFIDTDMARSISDDKFAERLSSIGMGRIGLPDEVADVALFLAGPMSRYVTGQTIGVDGGMLI